MIIALIGENCTGKTSVADALAKRKPVKIFAGKDYLRMAKNQGEAEEVFRNYLSENENQKNLIVFIIAEPELLKFLPEHALKVRCQAPLDTIKERFAKRMHGNMPPQVAAMLEEKHGRFDGLEVDFSYDTTQTDVNLICDDILARCD